LAIRSTVRLKFSAAACLFLAGCGGGGSDTLGALLAPLYGNNLSSDALAAYFVSSFDAFEDRARELRNSPKYREQRNDWYIDSNGDEQRNPATEPLYNSYPLASARIEYAHAVGLTGAGQTISIVDDGFLATHESISNRVAIGSVAGAAESHGTAVASVAAGNSSTFIGVAPGASVLLGTFDSAGRIQATNLARTSGAVVQNNSWGFPERADTRGFNTIFENGDSAYLDALRRYTQNGVVVFAADNNFSAEKSTIMEALPRFAPELEAGWLAVVSGVPDFDNDRILSAQRMSSACLDAARWCLAADGTWDAASASSNSSYSFVVGTSFAAPMVSGAIALLAEAFPNLTPHDLRARLIASADNRLAGFTAAGTLEVVPGSGFFHDYSTEWGHGFLDVRAALLPIGTPVARMADGSAHSTDTPLIVGGGATGDAIARSLQATPVLVTDLLGGDFSMPGEALAATATPAPVSERLWESMFGSAPRSGLMREYGGGSMTMQHDGIELAMLGPDASGPTGRAGSDPAVAASIGQTIEAAGGEVFIGLNIARDDGSLMPGIRDARSTLAALELGFMRDVGSKGFIEFGGTFGLSPGGAGAAMSDRSDIRFNAFRIEAGETDVLRRGDRLSLGLSMPVAVTSGGTKIALPVARSASGISYRDVEIDYAPEQREIDLSITYGTPFGDGGEVFIGAIHAFNHGHVGGQQDTAAILGFRMSF